MPFVKNEADKICLALEAEVKPLVAAGWKVLTDEEDKAYRDLLNTSQELTSHASQEAARIEAGLYGIIAPTQDAPAPATGSTPSDSKPADEAPVVASGTPLTNSTNTTDVATGATTVPSAPSVTDDAPMPSSVADEVDEKAASQDAPVATEDVVSEPASPAAETDVPAEGVETVTETETETTTEPVSTEETPSEVTPAVDEAGKSAEDAPVETTPATEVETPAASQDAPVAE